MGLVPSPRGWMGRHCPGGQVVPRGVCGGTWGTGGCPTMLYLRSNSPNFPPSFLLSLTVLHYSPLPICVSLSRSLCVSGSIISLTGILLRDGLLTRNESVSPGWGKQPNQGHAKMQREVCVNFVAVPSPLRCCGICCCYFPPTNLQMETSKNRESKRIWSR